MSDTATNSSPRRGPLVVGILAAAVLLVALAAVAIAVFRQDPSPPAQTALITDAEDAISPILRQDGSILYGERQTGQVRLIDARGELDPTPVAAAEVLPEPGQRGLLGLAVDRQDRLFAAWTRVEDGRVVVGELNGAAGDVDPRIVWLGPPSTDLANGGHLVVAPDGRLIIGIGDLQDRSKLSDPDAPNGKILALDPLGSAEQKPVALSSGWNNPFAFVFEPDGALWVADNAPGDQSERIGRGDKDGLPRIDLEGQRAPSVLISVGPNLLGLCGYLDATMHEIRIDAGVPSQPGMLLAQNCSTGASVDRADDRLVVTNGSSISELQLETVGE